MYRSFSSISRVVAIIVALNGIPVAAQSQLSPDIQNQIDKIAADALASSGVPSASVAVVKNLAGLPVHKVWSPHHFSAECRANRLMS